MNQFTNLIFFLSLVAPLAQAQPVPDYYSNPPPCPEMQKQQFEDLLTKQQKAIEKSLNSPVLKRVDKKREGLLWRGTYEFENGVKCKLTSTMAVENSRPPFSIVSAQVGYCIDGSGAELADIAVQVASAGIVKDLAVCYQP